MAYIWILTLALVGGASASSDSRVAGGNATRIEYYPWLVQVDFLGVFTRVWSQSCAGSVLTNLHILSAAHCFSGPLYNRDYRRVRAGTSDRHLGGVLNYIVQEFNHPSFGTNGFDGDITVVRLRNPLDFNPVIQAGPILRQGLQVLDNIPAAIAGWGATFKGGPASRVLRDTVVYTINNEICRDRYLTLPTPGIVTRNMICVGFLDVEARGACEGDAGGPLTIDRTVIGIVSWGQGCGNKTFPSVVTTVSSYTDWILAQAV